MEQHGATQRTFASFYDFYDSPDYRQDQLQMYQSLASEIDNPILELACGTGIITIELARSGSQVMGVDISSEMLQVALEKITREDSEIQSRIRFVEADMKNFDLGESFRGIFLPNNSLGYLTQLEDQKSCLRAISDHLVPDGMLVIEERNYTPETLMGMQSRRGAITIQRNGINQNTGKFTTFHSAVINLNFAAQTISTRRYVDEIQEDGTLKRFIPSNNAGNTIHFFNRFELQFLIEQAGFTVRDIWGSPDTYGSLIFMGVYKKPHKALYK